MQSLKIRSSHLDARRSGVAPEIVRSRSSCRAIKRVIEPAYFQDIFDGAADRVVVSGGSLKREETLVLVESVKSVEQAYKTLELIVRHLENRVGMDVNDWHHRKKYYMRLCELAMKMERGPDVVLAIFSNLQRFQISTYFGKEVIQRLGAKKAHPGLLLRVAELCKLQRGAGDKGVRSAYLELIDVLSGRSSDLDKEFLARAKAGLKALQSSPVKIEADAQALPPPSAVAAASPAVQPQGQGQQQQQQPALTSST